MTSALFPLLLAALPLPLCVQEATNPSIQQVSPRSVPEDASELQLPNRESIASGVRDKDGFLCHEVESLYQAGQTNIRVLPPDQLKTGESYPTVYVLPVEPQGDTRYGDGLIEVRKHNCHNKYGAIFVAPAFSDWPWYADHPTKQELRQESHFLNVVMPFVEKTYPVSKKPKDRHLLGFSKSGWGSWSLLLRHLKTFGRAAAWDAPLMMTEVGEYANRDIFGTQENFERYRPANLLRMNASKLNGEKRLILTGYDAFRQQHEQTHELLRGLEIPHDYSDGPKRQHDWHSGWVCEAVQLLLEDRVGDEDAR